MIIQASVLWVHGHDLLMLAQTLAPSGVHVPLVGKGS